MGQYPKITLPAMPRKALFVGEADIRERRVAFDELVKFISKNSTLATCPEVLELLGNVPQCTTVNSIFFYRIF